MDDEEKKRRKERGEDDSSPRNKKVVVEAIYEPPQESDPESAEGYVVLEDPNEDTVERVVGMLGLKRVGWIFGHLPREDGFQLSAAEIITAAEFQLESAGGGGTYSVCDGEGHGGGRWQHIVRGVSGIKEVHGDGGRGVTGDWF